MNTQVRDYILDGSKALIVIVALWGVSLYHIKQQELRDSLALERKILNVQQEPYLTLQATSTVSPSHAPVETVKVPILTYHRIRPHTKKDSFASRSYITTPEAFEKELAYLKENHYTVISMKQLLDAFEGAPLPEKPVMLTFDDAYKEHYTYVLPLLKRYQIPATFFIYTKGVTDGYRDFMTWDEVRKLVSSGMTIGAHTVSHSNLTKLSLNELSHEVLDGKKKLEDNLGIPITVFAYPYGVYNDTVINFLKTSGFVAAFTLDKGALQKKDHMLLLTRYNLGSSFEFFTKALQGK